MHPNFVYSFWLHQWVIVKPAAISSTELGCKINICQTKKRPEEGSVQD